MTRPSDWYVLDLDSDPTPGDPARVDTLANRFMDFSETAERAYRSVTSLQGDSAVMSWVGLSGDAFREKFGGFPEQLRKLYISHEMVGDALTEFSPQLSQAQSQADRALADGREARAQLDSTTAALTGAATESKSAGTQAESLKNPDKSAPAPDPDQVAQAVRNAQAAQERESAAQGAVNAAQAALDAAKSLAEQAAALRTSAAQTCAKKIDEGSDAGIQPRSFWQKLVEALKKLWDIICEIAKWVALVAGVIALIIGGPLAWVALAAGVILLVKAIVDYTQGKGSVMDLVFGILGVIPGVKGLTTLGRLKELYRAGGLKEIGKAALANAKNILPNLANVIRNGNAGTAIQTVIKGIGNLFRPRPGAGGATRGVPNETDSLLGPNIPAVVDDVVPPINVADEVPPVNVADDIPVPHAGGAPEYPPYHLKVDDSVPGGGTFTDPSYPGMKVTYVKTDDWMDVYKVGDPPKLVVFDDANYIKYDEGLETFNKLMNDEIKLPEAQVNLKDDFKPQSPDTYHFTDPKNVGLNDVKVNSIDDFANIDKGKIVLVKTDVFAGASGRENTVAAGLKPDRLNNIVGGIDNGAAIPPIKISLGGNGISILDGNHRLGGAIKSGQYEYVPVQIM